MKKVSKSSFHSAHYADASTTFKIKLRNKIKKNIRTKIIFVVGNFYNHVQKKISP